MEKMGSCPRRPKLTQLNLGPRSLTGLIIHSQFLLLWFDMPGMPIVKPLGLAILGDPGADKGGEGKFKRAENIYMERRKVKNGEKSAWGQSLTRPVPNGRRRSGF